MLLGEAQESSPRMTELCPGGLASTALDYFFRDKPQERARTGSPRGIPPALVFARALTSLS